MHFGEDEDRDQLTIEMINSVIRKEEPDFIAITGDIVSGQMYDVSDERSWVEWSATQQRKLLDNLHGLPFAWVPGFHDLETHNSEAHINDTIGSEPMYAGRDNQWIFLDKPIENDINHRVMLEKNDGSGEVVGSLWFFGNGKWECLG